MCVNARSIASIVCRLAVGLPVRCVGTPLPTFAADTAMTASEALSRLKSGNDRFSHDAAIGQAVDGARRAVLAKGQAPFATVLSCADSRVPPEVVFNVGLGDLFVVRAAGEVTDRSILASLEYGAEHLVGAYYELASGKVLFSDTPHEVTDAQFQRGRLAAKTTSPRKH